MSLASCIYRGSVRHVRREPKANEFGYRTFGGSDSHVVSRIGYCATDFADDGIETIDDLVSALSEGEYSPVSFRPSGD